MKTKIKESYNFIKEKIILINKNIKKFIKENYKYILIFSLIYFIALIPLIRANINYKDDLGRIRYGYRDFGFGRYVSDYLSILLHGSSNISDISPFTTLLAIVIMALASTIILRILLKEKKIKWYHIAAALPIGMNPYFLECYAYKYDAPYMALSVLFSTIPFIFYKKEESNKNTLFIIVSIICTFLMASSYQASAGIFPIITIILVLTMFSNKEEKKEIFKFIYKSVIGYGLGLIIFKLILPDTSGSYINPQILSLKDFIPKAISNYGKFYSIICEELKLIWLIIIISIIITFILKEIIQSQEKKVISITATIISLILMFLLVFGVYPFLTEPIFEPRSMYVFFILISILAIECCSCKHNLIIKVLSICLAYAFFTTSLIFGNACFEQFKYNQLRLTLLINDINNLDIKNEKILKIDIEGTVGRSKKIDGIVDKLPVFNKLLPTTLGDNNSILQVYEIATYYDIPNVEFNTLTKNKISDKEMELVKETRYHSIYQKDNYVLVKLKKM